MSQKDIPTKSSGLRTAPAFADAWLAPNSKPKAYQLSGINQREIDDTRGNLTHEAISLFQTASSFYENGELTEK